MPDRRQHLDDIRAQFTRQAEAYARMSQTTDSRGLERLVGLSGPGAGDRVLDVACGPGFLTMTFAARCREATGVDATDVFLSLAREEAERRGLENLTFRAGDAEKLPLEDASFDLAVCRAAFHHFPRPERVLAEMSRTVRPGGKLLVADMLGSEDPTRRGEQDRIERLCDPTHARALPASEFEALFAAAGLEILLRPRGAQHYDVEEWIEHGGPEPSVANEIREALEASATSDTTGLDVHHEDGRLRFRHVTAAFVLGLPAINR